LQASTPEEGDSTFAMSQLDMILGQTGNNPLPISVASNNILQVKLQVKIILIVIKICENYYC
jgi:hypothetical protein